jgi:hypothetical protein
MAIFLPDLFPVVLGCLHEYRLAFFLQVDVGFMAI